MKRRHWGMVVAAALCVTVLLGVSMSAMTALAAAKGETVTIPKEEYEALQKYQRLAELQQIVDHVYYEDVDEQKMIDGAAAGLLYAVGDPYTFYYTPKDMTRMQESATGIYTGIGVQILANPKDFSITITRVFKESPAFKAGMRKGDKIVQVGEEPVSAYEINLAVDLMRGGAPGTEVDITVVRESERVELKVTRDVVKANSAEYRMIEDDIGYFMLYNFEADIVAEFREAVKYFTEQGAKGLIIDVRGNPGGIVDYVVDICDDLLPEGLIVYTEDKYGRKIEQFSKPAALGWPLVILVDENSASASEILAAAVQDHGVGKIVGTTTFGKGIVQMVYPFPEDGAGMQVTIARYFTPKGVCIHGIGVTPDVEIKLSEDALDDNYQIIVEKDNQLSTAVDVLREQMEVKDAA